MSMGDHDIKRVGGRLTVEQKRRHQQIREHVRRERPRLTRDALGKNGVKLSIHVEVA